MTIRCLTALFVFLMCGRGVADDRPNVVFILADDLGSGDLKCQGHPYARTPNIDRLAEEGTRFTRFYSAGVTCCPARTGLMTSRFPARFQRYPADFGFGDRVTVTELLKKAGYRTGHFGKWHMGPNTKPGTYGIDRVGSEDQPGGKKQRDGAHGRDHHIFEAAAAFIEANKDGPFYVNVWGHISHNPVNPSQTLVGRWKSLKVDPEVFPPAMREKLREVAAAKGDIDDGMRRYLADVESLDADVGRLLKRIDELGLSRNTVVVFSSDQGADMTKASLGGFRFNQMGYNGAHRGGKHTHLEGGLLAPFIVRWPGRVPAKRVDETSVLAGVDWLPTLCSIAGAPIPSTDLDGEDMSSAWFGKPRERTRPLFWKTNNVRSESVMLEGRWKLFVPFRKRGEPELYDLATDPAEQRDLSRTRPEIVARLKPRIAAWNATLPTEYTKSDDKD